MLGVLSSTSKTEEATEIADAVDVTLVKRLRTLGGCSSVPPLCKALQIRNMDGASRAPVENDFKEFLADATTRKTSFGNNDFLAKEASCQIREIAEEMVDSVGRGVAFNKSRMNSLCASRQILQGPVALMTKDL